MRGTLIVLGSCLLLALASLVAPGLLNAGFDAMDALFGWTGPLVAVSLVSLATGILFLVLFPHVSAQNWIKSVKDKIKFHLLSIRLYQDNPGNVLRSTGGALGWNFAYLGLNILPMVVLVIPFMVIWFQLNALYAFEPLQPGDERVVVAELKPGTDVNQVQLAPPTEGWSVVQGPVRLNDRTPRVLWTLRAEKEGIFDLTFQDGGESVTKTLAVGERPRRLAKVRTASPWANFFAMKDPILYFGEPVLSKSSFLQTVTIDYPNASFGPFDGEIGIMILFVLISIVAAFALKGPFGVEI